MAAIDVLIPVYNGAKTIESAVESMLAQTFPDFRLVIINDGSTDASGEILKRLAARDGRIFLLEQPNAGAVAALNNGLAHCDAPLIARFDQDDLSDPNRLEVQKAYMEANPDVVASASGVRHIDENGGIIRPEVFLRSPDDADNSWAPVKEPYLAQPFSIMRRDPLKALGGYRPIHYAEDVDLNWRLRRLGRIVNQNVVLGSYRMHTSSMSGSLIGGRVLSVSSQLAGISDRRVRAGLPDIEVPDVPVGFHIKAARPMEETYQLAAAQLTPEERDWLRVAAAAKLMEFAPFRGYDLEPGDLRFLASAYAVRKRAVSPENARDYRYHYAEYMARLLRRGRFGDAQILLNPGASVYAARHLVKGVLRPAAKT